MRLLSQPRIQPGVQRRGLLCVELTCKHGKSVVLADIANLSAFSALEQNLKIVASVRIRTLPYVYMHLQVWHNI